MGGLTILNRYVLTGSPEDFSVAVANLARRVEKEGHPGVVSYRFFLNTEDMLGRAVIDYVTADAWIGHHDIAMDWPEMRALHDCAKLEEIVFLGTPGPEIEEWIAQSKLTATVRLENSFVAGFAR